MGFLKLLVCALIGYLIGTVNPSYIVSRCRGFDIRKKGSGNAGASNAVMVLGKMIGIVCARLDIAKACAAIALTEVLFPELPHGFVVTGAACILGHIFPFYMGFRGGKGLASLGGVILMFQWKIFLIMLALELVLVLITGYICFVPMTASVAFAILYGVMRKDLFGAILLLLVSLVILLKHRENLGRIRQGVEVKIRYLWNAEKEKERLARNAEKNNKENT